MSHESNLNITADTFGNMSGLFGYIAIGQRTNDDDAPWLYRSGHLFGSSARGALSELAKREGVPFEGLEPCHVGRWITQVESDSIAWTATLLHITRFRFAPPSNLYLVGTPQLDDEEYAPPFFVTAAGPDSTHLAAELKRWNIDARHISAFDQMAAGEQRVEPCSEVDDDSKFPVCVYVVPASATSDLAPNEAGQQRSATAPARAWFFTPGKGATDAKACLRHQHMAMGWGLVPDLRMLDDDQLLVALHAYYGGERKQSYKNPKAASKAINMLRAMQSEVALGDVVFMRKGRRELLAVGRVTGGYRWDLRYIGEDDYSPNWRHVHRIPVAWQLQLKQPLKFNKSAAEAFFGHAQATETLKQAELADLIDLLEDKKRAQEILTEFESKP